MGGRGTGGGLDKPSLTDVRIAHSSLNKKKEKQTYQTFCLGLDFLLREREINRLPPTPRD